MKVYENKETKKRIMSSEELAKEHWKEIKKVEKKETINGKLKSNKIIK